MLTAEAMGLGDVKFMAAIGAFLGWQGALFAVFAGAGQGLITFLLTRITGLVAPKPEPEVRTDHVAPVRWGKHVVEGRQRDVHHAREQLAHAVHEDRDIVGVA